MDKMCNNNANKISTQVNLEEKYMTIQMNCGRKFENIPWTIKKQYMKCI